MTRDSPRELASDIDDLRDEQSADTVYDWLRQYVVDGMSADAVDVSFLYDQTPIPDDEMVAYVATDGQQFSVPPEDLPAWIDSDDLPIQGTENRRNPFVVADFTDIDT
jgi:hypothetical protein